MKTVIPVALVWALIAPVVYAETPEEKGYAIAQETDKRDSGFGDSSNDAVFTLRDAQGERVLASLASRPLKFRETETKISAFFISLPMSEEQRS